MNSRHPSRRRRLHQPPVRLRRAERELTFWTIRQILGTIVRTAVTAHVVVELYHGRLAGVDQLTTAVEKLLN